MIRLRDFAVGDFEAFSALSGDEPTFTFTKGRLADAKVAKRMDRFVAEPAALPRRSFTLVVENTEGSLAGWAGLDGMDVAPGQAQFGWYLGSSYWGRGYATEATALLLEFGFNSEFGQWQRGRGPGLVAWMGQISRFLPEFGQVSCF
ncbi:MAG: GNAT family N-acetyltransferase [Acidimicrobiales bacterium]